MAKKYKVMADEQFLGHYYAQDGKQAIRKAVYANFIYHPEIIGMEDCLFSIQKSKNEDYYSWSAMPELAEEFEIPVGDVF